MFDIGFSELVLIALVALVVLGPERLPKAARLAGMWMRKARTQWNAVKDELERELASEELQRSLKQAQDTAARLQAEVEAARRGLDQQVQRAADEVSATLAPAAAAVATVANEAPAPRMPGSPFTEQELRDAGFLDDDAALPLAEAATPVAAVNTSAPAPQSTATHADAHADVTHDASHPDAAPGDSADDDDTQASLPFALPATERSRR